MEHAQNAVSAPSGHTFSDDELSDDALTGRVRLYQRKRGHRYSIDDVLTAWVALHTPRALAGPSACLDLGCGIGSVLLMLADKLPLAELRGVEAQDVSYQLVQRNIERNGLAARVQATHGDIRDELLSRRVLGTLPSVAGTPALGFDLVTGTPPYMPEGTATASPDSQRAHARIELRGGVEVYLLAASRVLAPGGVAVVCSQGGAQARVHAGAAAAGLVPVARLDAMAMQGRLGGLFSVHTLMRAQDAVGQALQVAPPFIARDEHGARTQAAVELRRFFDVDTADEAPSPRQRVRRAVSSQDR